jgi:hypothetical protein
MMIMLMIMMMMFVVNHNDMGSFMRTVLHKLFNVSDVMR